MPKTTMSLVAKVAFLKIPPEAWDAIFPQGPKVSQTLVEYMAAGVVRDIAGRVKDKAMQAKLMATGKDMVNFASQGLVQGWEDGDDLCPPWPIPWPWWVKPSPDPWKEMPDPTPWKAGPLPDPWKISSVEQVVLADLLMTLSGVTTSPDFGARMKDVASGIIKGASAHLVEEFGKSNLKPRSLKSL